MHKYYKDDTMILVWIFLVVFRSCYNSFIGEYQQTTKKKKGSVIFMMDQNKPAGESASQDSDL